MRVERAHGVWWLSPAGAIGLIALPTLYVAVETSDSQYRLAWGAPKVLTTGTVLLIICGALAFVLSSLVFAVCDRPNSLPHQWPVFPAGQVDFLERAASPLFWLTITGYLAIVLSAARNGLSGSEVVQALITQNFYSISVKGAVGNIPVLTSLTQVGMAFTVVAMLILVQRRRTALLRRLLIVLILGLVRSAILSERLAILELLVPVASILAFRQMGSGRSRRRLVAQLAPAVFMPLLLVAFGAFEYSRSWVFYSSRTSNSYAQFTVERLAGYYATAYNNGQLALDYERRPGRVPYSSIEALWTAPGLSSLGGYAALTGVDPVAQNLIDLRLHGNLEFNSPGGLLIPFVDWGTTGGLIYLGIAGGVVGWLYRRCVYGNALAVLLYPSMTAGLFELPRYIYWVLGRYTPSLLALCVVGFFVTRRAGELAVPPPIPAEVCR